MKPRTLLLCSAAFLLSLSSCDKNEPKASFTVNSTEPEAFDTVFFTNTSENAAKYAWDFGDGNTSTAKSPIHIYEGTGNVEVNLKVWNADDAMASTKKALTITDPTILELDLVMDGTTTPVADCPVLLFLTEDDMWNVENVVDGDMSDQDGVLLFKAKPVKYFAMALKEVTGGFLTNIGTGYETEVLTVHEWNKYTLTIEFVSNKKSGQIKETIDKILSRRLQP